MTTTTGTEFREARRKLGLSVTQCATLTRTDPRTIRRWETGAGHGDGRNPSPQACRIMDLAIGDRGTLLIWRALVGNPPS